MNMIRKYHSMHSQNSTGLPGYGSVYSAAPSWNGNREETQSECMHQESWGWRLQAPRTKLQWPPWLRFLAVDKCRLFGWISLKQLNILKIYWAQHKDHKFKCHPLETNDRFIDRNTDLSAFASRPSMESAGTWRQETQHAHHLSSVFPNFRTRCYASLCSKNTHEYTWIQSGIH